MDFLSLAQTEEAELIRFRRHLHQNPELSWQEKETTKWLAAELKKIGLEPITWPDKTGVLVEIHGTQPGKTIALRADIDALPVQEENQVPYASQRPGVMHACGHDGHAACLLGAARLLVQLRAQMKGSVRLLFQPAEECGGGAFGMLEKNVLQNPVPDAVCALHCTAELPTGTIGLRPGPLMAACDSFRIVLKGRGGHGAMPHKTRDPIVGAAALIQSIQTIVARNTDPLSAAVISFGSIHGGAAGNVIPETVVLEGTLRTLEVDVRKLAMERLQQVTTHTALALELEAALEFSGHFPAVNNPPDLTQECKAAVRALLPVVCIDPFTPVMATEDFSVLQQKVPGVLIWLGAGNAEKKICQPLHHVCFDLDEDALVYGTALYAALAWSFLEHFPGK